MLNDIVLPKDLMGGFLESMPAMFFGGSNSVTFLHYDIDLPHIFHTHFGGRKHVILFENKWKRRLYCLPNATYALEDYDVAKPGYQKIPGTWKVWKAPKFFLNMAIPYLCLQATGIG